MGFTPKAKLYRLTFDDPDLEGLAITARSVSTGTYLELTAMAALAVDDMAAMSSSTRDLFSAFADAVTEWNLDKEDGTPWPIGLDALLAQDFPFVMAIIGAWMAAIGGVPDPLEQGSTSGATFQEASLPMEPWSPNQTNSLVPTS